MGIKRSTDRDAFHDLIFDCVRGNLAKLEAYFAPLNVNAFRVFDRSIEGLPFGVDWYTGHLVIIEYTHDHSHAQALDLDEFAHVVSEALGVTLDRMHLKRRQREDQARLRHEAKATQRHVVQEGDLNFEVDLDGYRDTGLFLDHRRTRALVRGRCQNKQVLNLFAYTGSFSCHADRGGATAVTTVDVSNTYLNWFRDNLKCNRMDEQNHEIVREDVLTFLRRAKSKGKKWDVIVVDPPSFATRGGPGGSAFSIQKHHGLLLGACAEVLTEQGEVWFSTNFQKFSLKIDAGLFRRCKEITQDTLPVDFTHGRIHRAWHMTSAS